MGHSSIVRRITDIGTPEQVGAFRAAIAEINARRGRTHQLVVAPHATTTRDIVRSDGAPLLTHDIDAIREAFQRVHPGAIVLGVGAHKLDVLRETTAERDAIAILFDSIDDDVDGPVTPVRLARGRKIPRLGPMNRDGSECRQFRLKPDALGDIDALADAWGCSRSSAIARAVRECLDRAAPR